MSRPSKAPRIYRRRDSGFWIIRDEGRFHSTGTRDEREAQGALQRYIAERERAAGPTAPDKMTVADVLAIYGRERAPHLAAPERVAYAIDALLPILGSLPIADITGAVCRRYQRERDKAPGTVRKELGTLAAAINYCHAEGYLTATRKVTLPAKPPPRDRWLERDEAARLLWAAYRNPKAKHLARFILIALYTGTRSDAILGLRFMRHTQGGWIDTERGLIYRRAEGTAETKKRQPPVPIPPKLLAHLRRWERTGARWAVEFEGQRVGSVKRAWATALAESGIDHATRHDLRHTAITWAMRCGVDRWSAAGFFGLTMDQLEATYAHHRPDHLRSAVEAMQRRA